MNWGLSSTFHALRKRYPGMSRRLAEAIIKHGPAPLKAALLLRSQAFDLEWYREQTGSAAATTIAAALELMRGSDHEHDVISPLFSASWYAEKSGFKGSKSDSFLHYVMIGEGLGLSPLPWFDPVFFRRFNPDTQRYRTLLGAHTRAWREYPNAHPHFDSLWYLWRYPDVARGWGRPPVAHFAQKGSIEGREPNPCFSARFYIESYPDVVDSGSNPALHFSLYGIKENRSPGPNFDLGRYKAHYGDYAETGLDAMAHYLMVGRREGRHVGTRYVELWDLVRKTPPASSPSVFPGTVDVIVPVYRDLEVTRACVQSLLASRRSLRNKLRIRLTNDASPEPEVAAYLREVARYEDIVLVENKINRGFVSTVNDAMRAALAAPDCGAVLLLNSDAEVANDWLDRMVGHLSDPAVGTVTALSNNATICSYPDIGAFPMPRWDDVATVDAAAADANHGVSVNIPTAVGFCMLIGRECLERTGLFDEEAFGRGYGEENDFCMRAAALGYRHVLATDVFVRHHGEVSFAGDSAQGKKAAATIIKARYPNYDDAVAMHCMENPARGHRMRVTFARWRNSGRPVTLIVTHDFGGGTERQVQRVARELQQDGHVVIMRPSFGHSTLVKLENPAPDDAFEIIADPIDCEGLVAFIEAIGVTSVQIHHLIGHSPLVRQALARMRIPYSFDVHDYFVVCPQINLITADSRYCEEPPPAGCDACIALRPSHGAADIRNWREAHRWVVVGASHVRAPSHDTAARIERFTGTRPTVKYHEPLIAMPASVQRRATVPSPGDPLRVVLMGYLSLTKGRRVVFEAIEAVRQTGLPIAFHLIGDPLDERPDFGTDVFTYTGPYQERDLDRLIQEASPDMFLFASVAPETYSFTLTEAMLRKRPIMATDIGAFAERLVGYPDFALYRHGSSGPELAHAIWAFATGEALQLPPLAPDTACEVST
jgi:GT2 family glycosyltransferase/glycosyltransferase involved in cell wall biosynthesis